MQPQSAYANRSAFGQSFSQPFGQSATSNSLRPGPNTGPVMAASPYITRQGMLPPSYQQRYLTNTLSAGSFGSANNQFGAPVRDYHMREQQLVARTETEIDEQKRKRQQFRLYYEREIQAKNQAISRNDERKEKLIAEIDALQQSHDEFHSRLMALQPPKPSSSSYEVIDRKQQEIMALKSRMTARLKELAGEQANRIQEQQRYWEEQLKEKEKILQRQDRYQTMKRDQLMAAKRPVERPDYSGIEDEIRKQKFRNYLQDVADIEARIGRLAQERDTLIRQTMELMKLRNPDAETQEAKRVELSRDILSMKLRVMELERVSKEMREANNNLSSEAERKEQLIDQYESDIEDLKRRKELTEKEINSLINQARQMSEEPMHPQLEDYLSRLQEDLKSETNTCSQLKSKSHKLYDLLCSNVHQQISRAVSEATNN